MVGTNGIFTNACLGCHNQAAIDGGNGARFDITNLAQVKERVNTTWWSANMSTLQRRIQSRERNNDNENRQMPPDRDDRLTDFQLKMVRYWILNKTPEGTVAP